MEIKKAVWFEGYRNIDLYMDMYIRIRGMWWSNKEVEKNNNSNSNSNNPKRKKALKNIRYVSLSCSPRPVCFGKIRKYEVQMETCSNFNLLFSLTENDSIEIMQPDVIGIGYSHYIDGARAHSTLYY